MLRDIGNIFENEEEENYYKPVTVSNFWREIEYKSNGDRMYQLKNIVIKLDHI